MGTKKLTIEEVKNKLKNINSNIEIISNEYINNYTKLKCKCLIDGYEWEITWKNLSHEKGCPKCSNHIKLTLNQIVEKLKIINPNIKILSKEYKNNSTKLKCKCLIDGHEWNVCWNNLSHGKGCPKCAGKLITIDEIKKELKGINPNIEILSDKYINSKTKLKCRCLVDNYEWETIWGVLKQGCGCPKCGIKKNSDKMRFSLEDIKEKLKMINPSIKILSNEYKNSHTKLKLRCLKNNCGYEWEASWDSIHAGNGCPKCSALKTSLRMKLTIDQVKERLKKINPDIIILSNNYQGNMQKLKFQCKICGYEWFTTWSHVAYYGTGCRECFHSRRRLTLKEIKQRLKTINPDVEILSNKYVNSKTKLHVRCLICGYEWDTPWNELHQYGCWECGVRKRSGKNAYNWKGGISELKDYLRERIIEWKKISMKRCNYKCVITGKRFDDIHHVYGFDSILEETMQITGLPLYEKINQYTNKQLELLEDVCVKLHYKYGPGVCLTNDIHLKFHELYGYGNNTLAQWEEFRKHYKIKRAKN